MPLQKAKPMRAASVCRLQQVETFKCLGVVFTSDGRVNKEIDTRIGKKVVLHGFIGLWSQNRSFKH